MKVEEMWILTLEERFKTLLTLFRECNHGMHPFWIPNKHYQDAKGIIQNKMKKVKTLKTSILCQFVVYSGKEREGDVSRKQAPEGYKTAGDAALFLEIPDSSFHAKVRDGIFEKTIFPGRKEGYYSIAMLKHFLHSSQQKGWSFTVALKEDIPEIRALIESNFSVVPPIPATIMEGWLRRNTEALHVLRRDGKMVGYLSLFPLTQDALWKRMRGEYLHKDIPLEDILPFTPGAHHSVYFADAVVNLQENDQRKIGAMLFRAASTVLLSLAEQGVIIDSVYAVGTTPLGRAICQSWGMEPLHLEKGLSEKRQPYSLNVATSSSRILGRYREKLVSTLQSNALLSSVLY